jgi:hypothetical protein
MGEPESPGSARRREELEQRLAESDAQIAALKDTVARLSHEASPRSRAAPAAARSTSPRPFSKMPAVLPSPGAASPRARSPRRAGSPRLGSPRAMSPRAGSPVAFGSTVGSRKKPMDPASFFTASMRGGPLTDPLPQRGLTRKERDYPERFCKVRRQRMGQPRRQTLPSPHVSPRDLPFPLTSFPTAVFSMLLCPTRALPGTVATHARQIWRTEE